MMTSTKIGIALVAIGAAALTLINIDAQQADPVGGYSEVTAEAPRVIHEERMIFDASEESDAAAENMGTRFYITPDEREIIEKVVTGEAENQGTEGQMLVAQCILNACEKDNIRPDEAIKKYRYDGWKEAVTDSVRDAVANVFDAGETVTDEPILYFYAPAVCTSKWHESQRFVIECKDHRFFKEV